MSLIDKISLFYKRFPVTINRESLSLWFLLGNSSDIFGKSEYKIDREGENVFITKTHYDNSVKANEVKAIIVELESRFFVKDKEILQNIRKNYFKFIEKNFSLTDYTEFFSSTYYASFIEQLSKRIFRDLKHIDNKKKFKLLGNNENFIDYLGEKNSFFTNKYFVKIILLYNTQSDYFFTPEKTKVVLSIYKVFPVVRYF